MLVGPETPLAIPSINDWLFNLIEDIIHKLPVIQKEQLKVIDALAVPVVLLLFQPQQ